MKFNISRLIGSVVVFCLAVGSVFGYALYGAGKKSAEVQRVTEQASMGSTSAGMETTNSGAREQVGGPVSEAPQKAPTKPVATTPTTTPVDTRKTSVYRNGTYTAVGSYSSPAGIEQISISVTLQNDVIANTSATSMANDSTSERYEQKFIGGYAAQIVGKNIDTVKLDFVSGSSLTPFGFNNALSKIKVSAKA